MTTMGRAFDECRFFLSLHDTVTKEISDSANWYFPEESILSIIECFLSNSTTYLQVAYEIFQQHFSIKI